ncbi:hypothetical protein IF1G_06799 [Cordyceps javanica]|uniref:Uncharacterized protein n=1 Tax=Cordyceps javanica TaxID=43265 RepID=A0A545UZA1_9HYPO|nr:hypothetical protein IF1G_06799 [Cordyceps javanica]TQW06661.1 hypothetical protein IF2G_06083 [Cordyceps javanica]
MLLGAWLTTKVTLPGGQALIWQSSVTWNETKSLKEAFEDAFEQLKHHSKGGHEAASCFGEISKNLTIEYLTKNHGWATICVPVSARFTPTAPTAVVYRQRSSALLRDELKKPRRGLRQLAVDADHSNLIDVVTFWVAAIVAISLAIGFGISAFYYAAKSYQMSEAQYNLALAQASATPSANESLPQYCFRD